MSAKPTASERIRQARDEWFIQGRSDGAAGVYNPPEPRHGARALSEYNIGNAVGERESSPDDEPEESDAALDFFA